MIKRFSMSSKIALSTFVLLMATLLPSSIRCQDYIPLVINPKIGANFSDLIISDDASILSSSQLGWNAGFDFRFGTRLLMMGGLHIFAQGSALENADSISIRTTSLRTSQLKIPFGVGYKVFRLDYFNVWIYTNAVLNFTVQSAHDEGWPSGLEDVSRSSIGGRVGIGFDISRFTVEVNYERGISDFINDSRSAKSHLVSMAVGYKI